MSHSGGIEWSGHTPTVTGVNFSPSLVSKVVTGVNCHLVELTSQLVFN